MLIFLCLSIGIVLGRAMATDPSVQRLGNRALLHVRDNERRVIVPVAAIPAHIAQCMRVHVHSVYGKHIFPASTLNIVSDARGTFVFAPPLPKGAVQIAVEVDGQIAALRDGDLQPDAWWSELICQAVENVKAGPVVS